MNLNQHSDPLRVYGTGTSYRVLSDLHYCYACLVFDLSILSTTCPDHTHTHKKKTLAATMFVFNLLNFYR